MRAWFERFGTWRILPSAAFLALSALLGLTGYSLVRQATNSMLESEARYDAETWAVYVQRNAAGLQNVARGDAVSAAAIAFLKTLEAGGAVRSVRVYDATGHLMMNSPSSPPFASPAREPIEPEVAAAMAGGKPVTVIATNKQGSEPAFAVIAVLPIRDNAGLAGWLVTEVDQTTRQAMISATATKVSLAVGALLIAASLMGFCYRARQKASVERQLESLSQHDQLTGLANQTSFLKSLDRVLGDSANPSHCALIVCEIADLSTIDQNFGQQGAENAVLLTANRLGELKPQSATVAAISHGRFAMLTPGVTDAMTVLSLAKDITAKLSEPVEWRGEHIALQVHAGIGLSASDGNDAQSLLRSAELALRSAQEQGAPGYGFFNPEIAKDARRRVAVQRAIADAVAAQSFRLDFQPVYNIRTGELNGFEALIRLQDAELGAITPGEFIPIAEQSGLINRIGAWCLQEACHVAAQWPAHLMVAVNLSPSQFYSGSLIGDVRQALDLNQFPSYRLEVEITEGTLLKDSELVLQQLGVLREMGLAVALDDFGTGYSSLSYLWKFPFSKLKIDRSFVAALDETQSARGILRSIIKLGHGLGLTVTAEGIENAKQLTTLRDLGCDLAQGYLLDRPARVADLAAIILRNFAKGLTRKPREPAAAEIPLAAPRSGTGSV